MAYLPEVFLRPLRVATTPATLEVKRQCILLGEELSPEVWLGQLEIEVATKRRSNGDEGSQQRVS